MTIKVREIGVDGKPGPERVAAPPQAPPQAQAKAAQAKSGPRWRGCVPASVAATALIALIPAFSILMIALSVLGTFYGARGMRVPVEAPLIIWANIWENSWIFAVAVVTQGALSVAQWGGRQLARSDRRWWLLYVASLALSIHWNWNGYWPTLAALGVPWLLALAMIAIGDIEPEIGLIRGE